MIEPTSSRSDRCWKMLEPILKFGSWCNSNTSSQQPYVVVRAAELGYWMIRWLFASEETEAGGKFGVVFRVLYQSQIKRVASMQRLQMAARWFCYKKALLVFSESHSRYTETLLNLACQFSTSLGISFPGKNRYRHRVFRKKEHLLSLSKFWN